MTNSIYIASDHGGFELKGKLIEDLRQDRFSALANEIIDLGPVELNPDDDYPVYAFAVAEKVAAHKTPNTELALGILICRSGNGMAIAANKVKGIRAALCFSVEHAKKAREHDDANILVLDADYAGDEPLEIVNTFLTSRFAGGRHQRRVQMITEYENTNSHS